MWLRQSTADQEISLGQFLDSTDGNTEENGLTIANTDIKLRKGGTITLSNKDSGGATNISNGVYYATLNAEDTNTLGLLEIYVHVAGARAIKSDYMVLPANSYDALVVDGLNNIAQTDIVSNGAITTSNGLAKVDPLYNGAIHIDSINGVNGTSVDINGTERNPVRDMSDALNLSFATKINILKIAPNSILTLSATIANKIMIGSNWSLELNNKDTSNATISGAIVSGITPNTGLVVFNTCRLTDITSGPVQASQGCYISGTFTATSAGPYGFDKIRTVEGSSAKFDFNSIVGCDATFRQYSGIISIDNLGSAANQSLDIEGAGSVTLNANCSGGDFIEDGNIRVSDNSSGTNITNSHYDSRFNEAAADFWGFGTRELTNTDVNIIKINGVTITGDGSNDPFDVS